MELSHKNKFNSQTSLTEGVRGELPWRIQKLHLTEGNSLIVAPPEIIIALDASLEVWGAFLSGSQNEWTLDHLGKKKYINVLGVESNKICSFDFHSHVFLTKVIAKTNVQYGHSFLYNRNGVRGRYSKQDINISRQGNLGLLKIRTYYHYCWIPSRSNKQGGGFSVKMSGIQAVGKQTQYFRSYAKNEELQILTSFSLDFPIRP